MAVITDTLSRRRSLALIALQLGLLCGPNRLASASPPDVPPERAALSGVWTVNKDLSDKPPRLGAMERGRRGGDGGPGGGDRPNPEDRKKLQAQMRSALEAPERLILTVEAESVIVTLGDGRTLRLPTNGERVQVAIDEAVVDTRVRWDKARLVKISSLAAGTKLTETYAVEGEPRRLHVTVTLENWRLPQPQTVRRVYDAAVAW